MAFNFLNRFFHMRLLLISLILLLSKLSYGQNKITYLANEGYMIEMAGTKVLIDALFKLNPTNKSRIDALSSDENNKLIHGYPPYDEVDFLLVTHSHYDHFNAEMVWQYMKNNDSVKIIASRQVIEKIKEVNAEGLNLDDRLIYIDLKMNDGMFTGIYLGLTFHAWWINHDGPTNFSVVNIAYLITDGRKSLLHLGDSEPQEAVYQKFEFRKKNIDYLILPFWHVYDSVAVSITNQVINPRYIIPTHILPFDSPTTMESIVKIYPDAIILNSKKRVLEMK